MTGQDSCDSWFPSVHPPAQSQAGLSSQSLCFTSFISQGTNVNQTGHKSELQIYISVTSVFLRKTGRPSKGPKAMKTYICIYKLEAMYSYLGLRVRFQSITSKLTISNNLANKFKILHPMKSSTQSSRKLGKECGLYVLLYCNFLCYGLKP